jgi:hypothetical protein
VASACKPWFTHFLFKAVEDGRIPSVDQTVVMWEPCLTDLNPSLGFKDREITFRHMANQISCYGVSENPGTAFDYNDWQMALFFDTLFLRVYGVTYASIDATVLHAMLTNILQCQDSPTFLAFGAGDRPGRVRVSVRDFARLGLLYLRQGNWNGTQLITQAHAVQAVTSPIPNSIPRTTGQAAQMCPGQRSIGSTSVPDNQTDHYGSYSWLWWTNGITRGGQRYWPDAPVDTFGAFGHGNGQRAVVVIPSLDLVVSWNDTTLGDKADNPNQAIKRLVAAVLPESPLISVAPTSLNRTVDYTQNLPNDTFSVANTGVGTLSYQISVNQSWLSVNPMNGSVAGIPQLVMIQYEVENLPVGPHVAVIQVSDNGSNPPAGNGPQTLTVTLEVRTVLPDADHDGDVDQGDFGRFQACYSGSTGEFPPGCEWADFNSDALIDPADFNVFLGCMSGPDLLANSACDDAYQ